MPINVNGYSSDGNFTGGPNGDIGFVTKDGAHFFIKRYNKYRYPSDASLEKYPEKFRRRFERCEKYRLRMQQITNVVSEVAGADGDIVVTVDFFKDGVDLYKINKKIDILNLKTEQICKVYSADETDKIMKRILLCVEALHNARLIHCDLKPENIFWVKKGTQTVGMVSDFDDSFLLNDIPNAEDIVATTEYLSPEVGLYIANECLSDSAEAKRITTKSDIYALGIVYHLYLTGEFPKYSSEYDFLYEATLHKSPIALSSKLDEFHRGLIGWMLQLSPSKRPTCGAVVNAINLKRLPAELTPKAPKGEITENKDNVYLSILVKSQAKTPVANATVTVFDVKTNSSVFSAVTDDSGEVKDCCLQKRKYKISVNDNTGRLSFAIEKDCSIYAKESHVTVTAVLKEKHTAKNDKEVWITVVFKDSITESLIGNVKLDICGYEGGGDTISAASDKTGKTESIGLSRKKYKITIDPPSAEYERITTALDLSSLNKNDKKTAVIKLKKSASDLLDKIFDPPIGTRRIIRILETKKDFYRLTFADGTTITCPRSRIVSYGIEDKL